MSNILIYYPSNKSSNVIETIAKGFVDHGHHVFLLTQSPEGDLHKNMQSFGIKTFSFFPKKNVSLFYYIRHLFFLISFCKRYQIVAVQSHLQQANIIAVFAQYFVKAKFVICRHHLVEPNKMSDKFDEFINQLAKTIVVPSVVIRDKLIKNDRVNESKVKLVPYVYDFNKYPIANPVEVDRIRNQYPCQLLILLCGRFVPLKRNEIAFWALEKLLKENLSVKLLALDEGPELIKVEKYTKEHHLEKDVDFLGYRKNVADYIAACDALIHPSYTEASNNTVKEAALYSKNVIVCKGVGDFSEYIVNEKNGYLADRDQPLEEMVKYLKQIYYNENRSEIGNNLKKTVYDRFHLSPTIIQTHLSLLLN